MSHHRRFASRLAAVVFAAGLPCSVLAQQPADHLPPGVNPAVLTPAQPPSVDPAAANFPLKFDHTTFDWGTIPDTDKVTHVFKFTNGSDKTVTIAGLQGSCGCTAGTLTKNDYAPNESGEITATFDPTNRVGPQPKTLTVSLKEGGSFILHLSSNVKPYVFIDQQKLQFMDIMKGTETTQGFTVVGRSEGFKVTSIDLGNPDTVTTEIGEPQAVEENGEKVSKVNVKVTLKKTLPIGLHSCQLTIHTNDTRKPSLQAMVGATVVGELRTSPPMLYVRQNAPSVQFETECQLDNRLSKAFDITAIDVEGPAEMQLVADYSNNPNGQGYLIKLSGVTAPLPGQYRGTVIVKTNVPDETETKIGFFVNVLNANGTIPQPAPANIIKPTLTPPAAGAAAPAGVASPAAATKGGGH